MLSFDLPPDWLAALLEGLQTTQQGLRALLHAVGLAPEVHGQPAWPFAQRVAAEMLVVDAGHARRVLLSLLCVGAALLALAVSVAWRRGRKPLWWLAAALVVFAPWPHRHLLLAPAVATSLHQSPTGFTAQGIVRGQAVYQQHCVRCHGASANGEGPDAAQLAMWPPNLNGALLWKRLDGELFWRVRHGMQGRSGVQTMPGFGATQLTDAQVWEVLDYLQAHAAGQMLRESDRWERPVRLPDMSVLCRQGQHNTARSLTGQRLRVVVPGQGAALPVDDPRLVTLAVGAVDVLQSDPDCRTNDAQAQSALALVLGVSGDALPGHQLIVDRSGWLRARGRPGDGGWSEDDLVCRTSSSPSPALVPVPNPVTAPLTTPGAAAAAVSVATRAQTAGDGLGDLIRRMDAEPVRLQRGGFPH